MQIEECDKEAAQKYGTRITGVRACIVPHAGLRYSGAVTASCFRLVDPQTITRILILAPSHSLPFKGIALPNYSSCQIPSGVLKVDSLTIAQLNKNKLFHAQKKLLRDPHEIEHALEVEFPLLRHYFPEASLIPLLVGCLNKKELKRAAKALTRVLDKHTLIVVSSDFTHYGPRFNYQPFEKKNNQKECIRKLDDQLLQPIFKKSAKEFLAI